MQHKSALTQGTWQGLHNAPVLGSYEYAIKLLPKESRNSSFCTLWYKCFTSGFSYLQSYIEGFAINFVY